MPPEKVMVQTSFVLPATLHKEIKSVCLNAGYSLGKFLRIAAREKIKEMKSKP